MFKVIAFALALGWGMAGWRNLPPIPNHYAGAAGTMLATSIALAYYAGTRRKRDAAIALAVAKAEAHALAAVQATQTVQVNLFHDTDETRKLGAQRHGLAFGLDEAPWMVGAHRAPEIEESDAIDSMIADTSVPRTEEWQQG